MQRLNEHNIINKLIDVEKNLKGLVYHAIMSVDKKIKNVFPGNNPLNKCKIVIVGGKCFDIGVNKNILNFLNYQHKNNIENGVIMSPILQSNDLSKFLTSSDIDVHLKTPRQITQAEFIQIVTRLTNTINTHIRENNLDYFNSIIKEHDIKAVEFTPGQYIKISYPTVRRLENLRLARLYMEFEFIDENNKKILKDLTILDPSTELNVRIISDSKIRIYIFDIVVESESKPTDAILQRINSHFLSNSIVKLPGFSDIHTLNTYEILNQIYGLILSKSNKLARNIVRLGLALLFHRNHYLSPSGINMCLGQYNAINNFIAYMCNSNHLNVILNAAGISIKYKESINPYQKYVLNVNDSIKNINVKHYRCETCHLNFYREMFFGLYDDIFCCCPINNEKTYRQFDLNHNVTYIKNMDLKIFDYYDINRSIIPSQHDINKLIYNRKNIMLNDNTIDGAENYYNLRDRFNQINVLTYESNYNYKIKTNIINEVTFKYLMSSDWVNICSINTINTYIKTFIFVENSIINQYLSQTFDSKEFDDLQKKSSSNQLLLNTPNTLKNSVFKKLLVESSKCVKQYTGEYSAPYNKKCRKLFIEKNNSHVVGAPMQKIDELQQRLIIQIFIMAITHIMYILVNNYQYHLLKIHQIKNIQNQLTT